MIVKKVKNPQKAASKAVRVSRLTDYIREPERENSQEKCIHAGARGFITDEPQSQTAEMIALSQEAVRSKDTINHYVLSWREGEQPSPEQVVEAVSIFMDELGVKDHQAIYGLHADTDNLHLHLAINRVHPETLKVVKINNGFDIEAAHKAIARIENAQGWQREQNGRYQVLENGELGREHIDKDKPRQPAQPKRDMENRTGEKSAERIAIEDGAPIIKKAQTWEQLHRELAAKGMRYEKTGSGATLFVGDVGVKASSADRDASLSKLQKRLGAYQPSPQRQQVAQREPEPIKPDVPGWKDYITGRKAHYAEKNAAKLALDKRQEQERKQIAEQQKARRDELMRGNWKGKGEVLNAMRSVIAAEQAAEKAALKEKHQKQREQHRQQFRPYPDLEQWQRMQKSPELAEQWRHRASEPQRIEGASGEPPTPRDIRAYQPEIVGQQVHYSRKEEAGAGGGVSFVDKGKSIDIHDWRNRDSTLAALQLSAQKWGSFTVTGNDEYKAMCAKLAAEHGFKITNPELQERIQQERQRIQQERAQAMKSEQLKQFELYAEAVGAERYRVTSIKMQADGRKQTFILDKKDGITRGFTPQEIEQRTPEMLRLQRRGENLYYTPLSDKKHHILIDDMNREKLERLIRDGYRPAVVLESSPGNYQAIITVPKLGTAHDKDVGNRLSDALNREYGDPKLSGAIHPHRAPGYENRKPKHQREDGSYPEVRLLKAERRECVKALALSSQIDAEYQRQAALKAQQPERSKAKPALELAAASGSAIDAYQRHYRDVIKRQRGGEVDLSRVDSMIAVRMRVTGHDQAAIEGAIRQCAPATRQKDEGRDWNDYAQRTARYAYSAAGDRQAAELGKYRQQWEKLEGREPVRQQEQAKAQKIERDNSPGMSR
ncbi:relaxase/mobilization nuclease domain-containing protein [Salmonella enterica]|uniref:TraI/MobA(P) family conjugative relaxase n=1 Tax=Salmonella enterica TaxID=28901 RepID=UPI0010827478|nr:TraI/MobA(P) family conjugative relaxase [Salmonella enterica]EFJ8058042.1 relaxase/mobilization nuclease domain-containing protein [Escherichia coli]EJD8006190.1 relaxase/mobilization nuclease domain-containing protein [Salmonella enterica subsp. enterica serovar Senftenberg]HCB1474955.1 relaxase/mobilization nuclease domain-containing protein [Citrobacter freundii]EBF0555871.1 mobilization protein [Salmonella enterica]EFM0018705.1 relaxase/mobilization nuclease domain-containing protein [